VSHRIHRGWRDKLRAAVPFGLGQTKPHHFAQFPIIAWQNRENLSYAWDVLSKGVCDGCALGVAGLHDWTIEGVHLCMTRLELLRLNTMSAFDEAVMSHVATLRIRSSAVAVKTDLPAFPGTTRSDELRDGSGRPIRKRSHSISLLVALLTRLTMSRKKSRAFSEPTISTMPRGYATRHRPRR
jgi:hypothetical protein